MNITINGESVEIGENTSVSDLLVIRKVTMPDMLTAHLNGQVVERDSMADTILKEGDDVELVFFMGGGSPPGEL